MDSRWKLYWCMHGKRWSMLCYGHTVHIIDILCREIYMNITELSWYRQWMMKMPYSTNNNMWILKSLGQTYLMNSIYYTNSGGLSLPSLVLNIHWLSVSVMMLMYYSHENCCLLLKCTIDFITVAWSASQSSINVFCICRIITCSCLTISKLFVLKWTKQKLSTHRCYVMGRQSNWIM